MRPDYEWSGINDEQRKTQLELRRRIAVVHERLRLLFSGASPEVLQRIDDAKKQILAWIDLHLNWGLTGDTTKNESAVQSEFEPLKTLLRALTTQERPVFVIPDTNALTTTPDPLKYKKIASTSRFHFILLAPVLGELDELKYKARDEIYRQKVATVIRRIAGWRRQGRLIDGVIYHSSITVMAVAAEPRFSLALSWLDPQNGDDRIIAATMEIQRNFASGCIVLVTDDLNLQNKADAAGIPWAEVPS